MMYLVKVTIKATNPYNLSEKYQPFSLRGTFVPKNSKTLKTKVEDQVKDYIGKMLNSQHPKLTFRFTKIDIERYPNDFTVVEDKGRAIPTTITTKED